MTAAQTRLSRGCSLLFVNDQRHVLLLLRDDNLSIPYPGMWDVPGGHVEQGETPLACIIREMKEEMGLDIVRPNFFARTRFDDRMEYTFWLSANLCISQIDLKEGQRLKWFTHHEARKTVLAYNFNQIIDRFFDERPFLTLVQETRQRF